MGPTVARLVSLLACALVVTGCDPASRTITASERGGAWEEPADYRFDVTSTCGERSLLGSFRVTVRDHAVVRFAPLDRQSRGAVDYLEPAMFPTLGELAEMATTQAAPAQVEVEYDDAGMPVWVSIDHLPNAIDDEECYRVEGFVAG